MIQTEALARLRILFNETAAGFINDTQCYELLDSAQNATIQVMFAIEDAMKKINPFYQHPSLQALLTSQTVNIVSGTQEYALSGFTSAVTDFQKAVYATCLYSVSASQKACTLITYLEAKFRENNTYGTAQTSPTFYVRLNKIGFSPIPDGSSNPGATLFYYKIPSAVASGQDFTLTAETHESIIFFALAMVLQKDGRPDEAQIYFNKFLTGIQGL